MTAKRPYRLYTTADRARLLEEYAKSGRVKFAADRAGVNEKTAYRWIIDADLHTPRKRSPDAEEIAEMRRLRYEEKFTVRTIARVTGWSQITVRRYAPRRQEEEAK